MKRLLVTGASSGIGAAVARMALEAGWYVGLLARRAELLEEVAGGQPNTHMLVADVTDLGAVEAAFARFQKAAGRVDVLFNNAGIFTPQGSIDEIDPADWAASVAVNLTGMFNCARVAFATMRRQSPRGGRIINNGSISAHVPREGSVCYTATKHGVTGLTRSLALDGRGLDIAAGQIDIGNAETPMVLDLQARLQREGKPHLPTMAVDDAARAVMNMAELPLNANVLFQTIMATEMPYIGRG